MDASGILNIFQRSVENHGGVPWNGERQDTGVITSSCLWKWKCQKTAMCGPCTEVLGFIPASSGKDTG